MPPPPGRSRSLRGSLSVLPTLVALLSLCACGLWSGPVPAAPRTLTPSVGVVTPSESPQTASTSSATPSANTSARTLPSGFRTHDRPAEPACVLPPDAPVSIRGADGPTLTAKRVEKAWRASEAAQGNQLNSGTVTARDLKYLPASPASAIVEPGLAYAGFSHFEYTGLRTYIYGDPGRAAAKLATVRLMLREPCSYGFARMGPYVVVQLSEDSPDQLVARGVMERVPVSDIFVRYGNTITDFSGVLALVEPSDVVPMILATLAKA